MASSISILPSSPALHAGACAAWSAEALVAIRAAFAATAARPLRVSCSTAAAAGGAAGGLFSGRADRAEYVTISRGLLLEHVDALGHDRFLGAAEGGGFLYLAQGLIRKKRGGAAEGVADDEEEELADLQSVVPAWPLAAPASPPPRGASVQLWMSPQATTAALHFDGDDNLLCVLRGRKRVALVAPADAARLQPPPEGHHCECDVWRGAPLGVRADVVDVVAGDVLAIPRGWWHSVQSDPGTVALNYWY